MSEKKKGSCLKRMAIGCGGLVAVFVLFGGLIALNIAMNQPEPTEQAELNTVQTFENVTEGGLNLPESGKPNTKPVRLVLDLAMADVDILPNDTSGSIKVGGDYDKANFELSTDVNEKNDHIEYRISFKNKRSLLGMGFSAIMTGENQDINNRLEISLPRDLLLELDSTTQMGNYEYDLTGLAVQSMDLDMSMGDMRVRMEEPNQVPMKSIKMRSDKGTNTIYDFQNFRFKEAELTHSMGDLRVRSSGPLEEDTRLHVAMKMGEARVIIPENAKLDSRAAAFMGEARQASEEPLTQENVKNLELSGGVTMGGYRVTRRKPGSSDGVDIVRKIKREGVTPYIEELKANHANNPDDPSVRRWQVNQLGYSLLRRRQYDDALAIFKFNTEIHPDYANGWDSLADCYRRMENYELSIENYKKALELDPNDTGIQNRLARVEAKYKLQPHPF